MGLNQLKQTPLDRIITMGVECNISGHGHLMVGVSGLWVLEAPAGR
jgi:hypothetical protein